ncbi:ComEC/Rec2 family competence protein [Aeromonas veronii]
MEIHFLEANTGDAFIVNCGENTILIDGGTRAVSKKIKNKITSNTQNKIKAIFVSHVDRDHVGGIIKLFETDHSLIPKDTDIYINHPDLVSTNKNDLGLVTFEDGDTLKNLLDSLGYKTNTAISGQEILINDICINIITPNEITIDTLFSKWQKSNVTPEDDGLVCNNIIYVDCSLEVDEPSTSLSESDIVNLSSITFTLKYNNKKALFLSDSKPEVICTAFESPQNFDIIKISHHGSKNNTSMALLKKLKCNKFIISTNGPGSYGHPHAETINRIIRSCHAHGYTECNLYFNYESVCKRIKIDNPPNGMKVNLLYTNIVSL